MASKSEKTTKKRNIVSFIFGLLLILLALTSIKNLFGIIALICGLSIFPPITNGIESKFKFKIKAWMKVIIFLIGFFMIIYASENNSQKLQETSQNKIEKSIFIDITKFSPCDFLPDENLIPYRLKPDSPKNKSTYCSQGYSEILGTVFNSDIYIYNSSKYADELYKEELMEIKSRRPDMLKDEENCFAYRSNNPFHYIVYLECNWGNVVYKETVVDMGSSESRLFLTKIPKDVEQKIIKLGEG